MFKGSEKESSNREVAEKAGQCLSTWEGHTDWVRALAVLEQGGLGKRLVVSAGDDNTIKCWEMDEKTGKAECLSTWKGHTGDVRALAVLEQGERGKRLVVSGSVDKTIKCWEMDEKTGKAQCLSTWAGHELGVNALAVLEQGGLGKRLVVSGSGLGDKTIKCWEMDEKTGKAQCLSTWEGHARSVTALAVLEQGGLGKRLVVSAGDDNTIKCWEMDEKTGKAECLSTWKGHTGDVRALAVLEQGERGKRLVLSASHDETIKCWEMDEKTGKAQCLSTWEGHTGYVEALAVLEQGERGKRLVVSGSGLGDKTIKCWEMDEKTGKAQCLSTWEGHTRWVNALAVLEQGERGKPLVLSASADKTIKCWQGFEPVLVSEWLNRAEQGELLAQYRLGQAYATGREAEGIEPTIGDAIKWWQVAAGQRFNKAVGQLYHYALQGEQRAIAALHAVASEGDPFVQGRLGQLYYQGEGVGQDIGAALKWMQLSAEAGYGSSQHQLAQWYYEGTKVPKDIGAALKWMQLSAETGNEAAKEQLEKWLSEIIKQAQQGEASAFQGLVMLAERRNNKAQYELAQLYHQGKGVSQDIGTALKWMQLSAEAGYEAAKEQLQEWQADIQKRINKLESISPQGSSWQRLKLQRRVRKQDSVIGKDTGSKERGIKTEEETEEDKTAVSLSGSESFSVSDSEVGLVEVEKELEVSSLIDGGMGAPGGVGIGGVVDNAEAVARDELEVVSSPGVGQGQARLTAHQLSQLLGAWHSELIECIKALGVSGEEVDILLKVDIHSGALAELYALVKQSANLDVHVYRELVNILGRCVPVYQLVGSDDSVEVVLPRLESVALLVQQAIEVVGQAHWLMRHQALGQLWVIAGEYAIASKAITEQGEVALCRYQGRASVAVLGEGYYHLPVAIARQLLCMDEGGAQVKANVEGVHAVAAVDGVHYKPYVLTKSVGQAVSTSEAGGEAAPSISPGKEYAVVSLMQLLGQSSLVAAPSTLLSIGFVPVHHDDTVTMTAGLAQGGLTITGVSLRDILSTQAALACWQSRVSLEAIVAVLQDSQTGFTQALAVAKSHYPAVFEPVIDMPFEAITPMMVDAGTLTGEALQRCSHVMYETFVALSESQPSAFRLGGLSMVDIPRHKRAHKMIMWLYDMLSASGNLATLQALLGILHQYPTLMSGQPVETILLTLKPLTRLLRLLPNRALPERIVVVPDLLTTHLDKEATSALWLGLLLTLPRDAKFDNVMVQIDDDKTTGQLQCRIVSIDNDMSLKMPFGYDEQGELRLRTKNGLLLIPGLLALPLHPMVRKHFLAMPASAQFVRWLSVLAKRDADYQQWQRQGTVDERTFAGIDIPVRLPRQVWDFIHDGWQRLQAVIRDTPNITLGGCVQAVFPLLHQGYANLRHKAGDCPLEGEGILYGNIKGVGRLANVCPLAVLFPEGIPEREIQTQCEEKASPLLTASQALQQQVVQLVWEAIPPEAQWPLVEALALVPTFTLADWQGAGQTHIRSLIQRWFREAVERGNAFVAQRLLAFGADVSEADESHNTALHQLCMNYLDVRIYPDSEAVKRMSSVLLTHHTCQPNRYNAHGYTPLLQWIGSTPEPNKLSDEQTHSAVVLLEALLAQGANLEAKDTVKHETALDKTVKHGREKWHWFEALVEKGAGVHANGLMIVQRVMQLGVAQQPSLRDVLYQLAERNLSVAWGLSQQVWQVATGKESSSTVVVRGMDVGNVVMPAAIAKVLFDSQRRFNLGGESADYGRRVVKAIDDGDVCWHVKENPEMPGIEMAVKLFSQRLFGEHTAPNELFSFFDEKDNPYPVLISQTVSGKAHNLQTVLNEPACAKVVLSQLHPQYTCEQLLLAMLVHPEDGKPDNYHVFPMTTTRADGKVITHYRLIGIDNDHAFVKPVRLEENAVTKKVTRVLQVKSVLFCLDNMRQPVHSAVRQRLLAIDPEPFLQAWLTHLMGYQAQSTVLFDKRVRERLFAGGGWWEKFSRRERLPVVVTVPFPDKAIAAIWDRLVLLQTVLRDNPLMSHLQLLKAMTPALGIRYEEAFELYEKPFEVVARFHDIAKNHYSTAIAGRYGTLSTSVMAMQAMGLNAKKQKALLDEQQAVSFTPQAASKQLREAVKQKRNVNAYQDALIQGQLSVLDELLSDAVKAEVVNGLDYQRMRIGDTKQPDSKKQTQLIEAIIQAKIAFRVLRIQHCAALTDAHIAALLRQSPGLTRLTLVDCPQLSDELGNYLQQYTPHLVTLTLRGIFNVRPEPAREDSVAGFGVKSVSLFNRRVTYDPLNLQHLRRVNISDNLQLGEIAIQSPVLAHATFKHNPKLTKLTLFCEELKALDVSGCAQLNDKDLHNTLQSYQALPRLNIDNCSMISVELWHCVAHVSQHAASHFPKWNMKAWQQSVLSLLPYASDRVVQIDSEAIEPNQLGVVMGLVASNPDAHTVLINLSPEHIATSLNPLLTLLQSNHSITALCITGASLNHVMAEHVITTVARCAAIRTLALTVDNSQAAIGQLQQVTQLSQVMVNGVDVTSLLQADKVANRAAIVNDAKGQQAMVVDVLALAMQHESSTICQSAANTLALLSASGKLPECKQCVTELLSGENPALLTVQHAELMMSSSSVSIAASSSSSAALISQFRGVTQASQKEHAKASERRTQEGLEEGRLHNVIPEKISGIDNQQALSPTRDVAASSSYNANVISLATQAVAVSLEKHAESQATLSSIRDIMAVNREGEVISCKVVPAKPDGNCGFIAVQRCLELQQHGDVANRMTRAGLKQLVDENLEAHGSLVKAVFESDLAQAIEGNLRQHVKAWSSKIATSSTWLSEHHLRFLSVVLALNFRVYCINPDRGSEFIPEPSYEKIGEFASRPTVRLAHVSSARPIGNTLARLNHFEGLCLEPTEPQIEQINQWLKLEEEAPEIKASVAEGLSALGAFPAPVPDEAKLAQDESLIVRWRGLIEQVYTEEGARKGALQELGQYAEQTILDGKAVEYIEQQIQGLEECLASKAAYG